MGIDNFAPHFSRPTMQSMLLTPLQALIAFFASSQPAPTGSTGVQVFANPTVPHCTASRKCAAHRVQQRAIMAKAPSPSRLRVVRAFEPGVGPSCAGRMVISGRMADVCAELDRMAQGAVATRQG